MTDKERAEEWCKENMDICKEGCGFGEAPYFTDEERCIAKSAFIDGFNADRWHYLSRGEYPPLLEYVFCKLTDDTYEVGYYQGQIAGEPEWAFTCFLGDVVAWQYIIPPSMCEDYE